MLSKCSQLLEENTEIDFVDLNLGCPIDLVYQKVSLFKCKITREQLINLLMIRERAVD